MSVGFAVLKLFISIRVKSQQDLPYRIPWYRLVQDSVWCWFSKSDTLGNRCFDVSKNKVIFCTNPFSRRNFQGSKKTSNLFWTRWISKHKIARGQSPQSNLLDLRVFTASFVHLVSHAIFPTTCHTSLHRLATRIFFKTLIAKQNKCQATEIFWRRWRVLWVLGRMLQADFLRLLSERWGAIF